MEIITQNAKSTQKLGEKIGIDLISNSLSSLSLLSFPRKRESDIRFPIRSGMTGNTGVKLNSTVIIALYGELGSGKTTFVQGLAKGLGIPHRLVSPTFIIVKKYELNLEKYKTFFHIDLYRIEKAADLAGLGLDEIFSDPAAIVAIEWPERMGELLPKERIDIRFKQIDEFKRQIIIGS